MVASGVNHMLTNKTDAQPLFRSVSSALFAVGGELPFERAVADAVAWLRTINRAVPDGAEDGTAFDVGGGGEHPARASLIEIPSGRLWAATVDNPDNLVLGRTWVTEIIVGQDAQATHFGARLLNVTRRLDEPFFPSLPRVVRDVVTHLPCAADGQVLEERPLDVTDEPMLDDLVELIQNPARRLPVVVVSQSRARASVADPDFISRRLTGAAHVRTIDDATAWGLSRRLGRQLSVFDGGARIYFQGFDPKAAEPHDHPLWFGFSTGSNNAASGIVARVLRSSAAGANTFPRFAAVREAEAKQKLESLPSDTSDADLSRLYQEENKELLAQLGQQRSEHDQWMRDVDIELSDYRRAISELKADVAGLRGQNEILRAALTAEAGPRQLEPLTDLSTFGDWVQRNVSPNLWFAPKAIKEIEKNGQFRDPQLLGQLIYAMDDMLVPMRREPSDERHRAYLSRLEELSCTDARCFAQANDIKRFPAYGVTYRGEKYWCDQHIKHGGGADPKQMFRVYYHWDEGDQVALIGHLPTHLDNNLTN